jgi:uncharacterized protein
MGDFRINIAGDIDLSRALVLVSFPTIGNVSSIAANYLVKKLKMERVGTITSKKFVPSAVIEDYVPSPPVRIYIGHCKCGFDAKCETFVVVLSEISPPEEVVHDLAEVILDWFKEKRVQYLVTMVGLKIAEEEEVQPEVYGIASKKSTREMLKKRGPKLLEKAIIGGMSGALLARGDEINMISLITQAHENHPEAGAAARLLETVDKVLVPLNISLEPLYEEAEKIEAEIKANLKGVPPGKSGEVPPGMYR